MRGSQESLASRLVRGDPATVAEMQELVVDPLIALRAAACGDLEAQRKLALAAWARAVVHDADLIFIEDADALEAALIFARLAAVRGGAQDALTLVNWLSVAAELMPATEPDRMGEALGWIQREADGGCEKAAEALNRFAAGASDEAIAIGKEYLGRLKAHAPHRTELN